MRGREKRFKIKGEERMRELVPAVATLTKEGSHRPWDS